MDLNTFLIVWFTIGSGVGIAAIITVSKDDKQITLASILMGIIMAFGGFVSGFFGLLAVLDKDYIFVKFKK